MRRPPALLPIMFLLIADSSAQAQEPGQPWWPSELGEAPDAPDLGLHRSAPLEEHEQAQLQRVASSNGPVQARRAAIAELAIWGDDSSVTVLNLLLADSQTGGDALRALAAIGGDEGVDALVNALADRNYRPIAQKSLLRIGDAAIPALIGALGDPTRAVPAAWIAGKLGNPSVVPHLQRLHSSKNMAHQAAAERALVLLQPNEASPAEDADDSRPSRVNEFVRTLRSIEPRVVESAAEALSRMSVAVAIPTLTGALRDACVRDQDTDAMDPCGAQGVVIARHLAAVTRRAVSEGAVQAGLIGEDKVEAARRAIVSAPLIVAGTPAVELKYTLRAVARDPWVRPWLLRELASSDPARRAIAARCLGFLGDKSVAADIRARIETEESEVVFAELAHAAVRMEIGVPISIVFRWMQREGVVPDAMVLGAHSLAGREAEASVRLVRRFRRRLRRELQHPDARHRAHAVLALGVLRDELAAPTVLALMRDRNPWVRLAVATALARIARYEFAGPLRRYSRFEEKDTVSHALSVASEACLHRRPTGPVQGNEVLSVSTQDGRRHTLDALLPSGLWLRGVSSSEGYLILPDLPRGWADVRATVR